MYQLIFLRLLKHTKRWKSCAKCHLKTISPFWVLHFFSLYCNFASWFQYLMILMCFYLLQIHHPRTRALPDSNAIPKDPWDVWEITIIFTILKFKRNETDMNGFRQNSLKSVRVYNDVKEWSGVVSVTDPILQLPVLIGEYSVECVDDSNHSFYGIIEY